MSKKKQQRGGARVGAGRPPLHDEGKCINICVSIPERLVQKLDRRVRKGCNRSQVITNLIRNEVT